MGRVGMGSMPARWRELACEGSRVEVDRQCIDVHTVHLDIEAALEAVKRHQRDAREQAGPLAAEIGHAGVVVEHSAIVA
jgi:hypothetical protein